MNNSNTPKMRSKLRILTISLGLVFLYFGALKLFPNLSPAEDIGISTVEKLTFGLISSKLAIYLLALLEVGIGLCLVTRSCLKTVVIIAIAHLVLTFTPFLFFPDLTFRSSFGTPSLLGQYIIKNIVLISALLVIYPASRSFSDLDLSSGN